MVSNTKATSFGITKSEMKATVNGFICDYPNSGFFHNEINGVTVLVLQGFINSNVMQVSMAVCSPDEKKYRKYVGEYICVENYLNGGFINIPAGYINRFIEALTY